jgi:CBS-domain-containing membrane protein
MTSDYHVLPVMLLQKGATFVTPRQKVAAEVRMDHPALSVMTDFSAVTAYTILPLESIEAARNRMIHHGVRSLLVVDDQNHILGIITASDLSSERPMRVIQTQGIRHADVLVKDIMTPREQLEVLQMTDLLKARVGDVVATLKAQGRQHALVVERREDQSQVLRGLFSASQIGRQLGTPIQTVPVARTFAELGQHLIGD